MAGVLVGSLLVAVNMFNFTQKLLLISTISFVFTIILCIYYIVSHLKTIHDSSYLELGRSEV